MIAIVESRADPASVNICTHLRELANWETVTDDSLPDAEGGGTVFRTEGFELRSFETRHLDLLRPAEAFSTTPDLLVFASRHAGETGPLLTGHCTGNFGEAAYGGEDFALAEAAPNALARLLAAFDEHAPAGYDAGLECTHHGPTDVGCPSLFAELGSSDAEWTDPAGAAAVARAIFDLAGVSAHRNQRERSALASHRNRKPISRRQVVGFGGGHYVPRFTRIVRETPWAVGHVAPAWALNELDDLEAHRELIRQAFETSRAELAVVDDDRPDLVRLIEALGYRVVSETWLRTVGDRPLDLVQEIEETLGSIAGGVRCGENEAESFQVVDLPADLLAEANAIDAAAVWEVVADESVAFDTEEGASTVGRRAALPAPARNHFDEIVDGLATILEEGYESVAIESDAVVATETAFDPELAARVGVEEGPAFGTLAAGEPVTVDGERIDPADVHVERTHRFSTSFSCC